MYFKVVKKHTPDQAIHVCKIKRFIVRHFDADPFVETEHRCSFLWITVNVFS